MYKKWIRHTVERLRVERALPVWRLKINSSHRSRSQAILGMPSEPVPKFGPRFGGSAEPNEQIRFCVRTRYKIWELFCERQAKVFFFCACQRPGIENHREQFPRFISPFILKKFTGKPSSESIINSYLSGRPLLLLVFNYWPLCPPKDLL